MTVYVDSMRAPYGRMIMCHMFADSLDELHAMADRIGVARRWFQNKPKFPHYDVCLSKRKLAVAAGAWQVSRRELVMWMRGRQSWEDLPDLKAGRSSASRMHVLPSRKWIDPLDLRPEDIHIEDIALSLSNQCRWTGHVYECLTVAEHSVLVSRLCEPSDALWGLLHDGTESYLNDFGRPVKEDPRFAGIYYPFERRAMRVICEAFGLSPQMPESVKAADEEALEVERIWRDTGEFYVVSMDEARPGPMSHEEARAAFLERFRELTEG